MKRSTPTTILLLGCLMAVSAGVAADEPFSPPEGLRVAMTRGVSSGPQPMVGRFGVFAPSPLQRSPVPAAALEPPKRWDEKQAKAAKKQSAEAPEPPPVEHHTPRLDPRACETACDTGDFSADAWFAAYDSCAALEVYNGKSEVDTQRPLVEWGVPFYGTGPAPLASERFGETNLSSPRFYVYGDYRVALAQNDLVGQDKTVLAHRLNLELDLWLTATERIHAFIGPFQEDARFMRIEDGEFFNELDLFQAGTDTLFFEGDLGQMVGGFDGQYAPFDLPVTAGLVPLLFQNGVWALDAIVGGAVTIPARNSPGLDWSNYDVTFFAGVDRISSGAFNFEEHAATLAGATTFIEARGGYLELGYGYVNDRDGADRDYHNLGVSYTRRYANLLSNSVRAIINTGQNTGGARQTADGLLLLVENSLLTDNPYNVIPYLNFFAGFDRPQPLARAGAAGGVLFNTGILFQSDQLTGYPTLDATGNNTYGAAVGVDLLSPAFDQQLIIEVAALRTMGERVDRAAAGNQTGVGARWQKRLSTSQLIRADIMAGLLDNSEDIAGARVEYRWKF